MTKKYAIGEMFEYEKRKYTPVIIDALYTCPKCDFCINGACEAPESAIKFCYDVFNVCFKLYVNESNK